VGVLPRLRILFLRRRGEKTIAAGRHYHELEQEVGKLAECLWAGKGWPLYREGELFEETVERVMPDADWVVDRERSMPIPNNRNYGVACYLSDLHGRGSAGIRNDPQAHVDFVNQLGYDAAFLKYEEIYSFYVNPRIFLDELKPKTFFLPWSVDEEEFKPDKQKNWDIAFIGSTRGRVYPLRSMLERSLPAFCRDRGLRLLFSRRTNVQTSFTNQQLYDHPDYYFGPRYADALSKTRFFIFGCSIFRYPLAKYFESMAAGCVVFANEPASAEKLGFIDGKTYVSISEKNWEDRLDYYLRHQEEADDIATNARKLIIEKHTHKIRAKQFMKYLKA